MKHLLKLLDLSKEEITELLDLADRLKAETKAGVEHHILKGKTLGMIFEKSSTRTRVSFETGMYQLGGHALFLSSRDLQIGRRRTGGGHRARPEPLPDGIMIRTFAQEEVETLARVGSIPDYQRALTELRHPCQVLADLQTVREYKGCIEGLNMCYIGDGNNMANSLIVGFLKMGAHVSIACPKAYQPDAQVLSFTEQYPGKFVMTESPEEAAKDADVIFTDVWASMGQEEEKAVREKAFRGYQINAELLAKAHLGCMVQHCLPAHRGEEITADVFESHADQIFDEAENRLHAQKAVMVAVMADKKDW